MADAYLESSLIFNNELVLNVIIVTDKSKTPHQFIFNPQTSANTIKANIKSYLDNVVATETAILIFPLGLMDLTIDPIIPPTKEELARIQLSQDLRLYRSMLNAVNLGLIKVDDDNLLTLKNTLITNFIPDYFDIL